MKSNGWAPSVIITLRYLGAGNSLEYISGLFGGSGGVLERYIGRTTERGVGSRSFGCLTDLTATRFDICWVGGDGKVMVGIIKCMMIGEFQYGMPELIRGMYGLYILGYVYRCFGGCKRKNRADI